MRLLLSLTVFLLSFLTFGNTYGSNELIGIWAQPNYKTPKVLWYFHENGDVKTTTNTSFNELGLKWTFTDNLFHIVSNDEVIRDFAEGSISDKKIQATHSYISDGKRKIVNWQAEKISSYPRKVIDFYLVCSNKKGIWEIVNIGKFESCNSMVPWEPTTSYLYEEAKALCLALVRKRKIDRRVDEKCVFNEIRTAINKH